MIDANLIIRDGTASGNLDATATTGAVKIGEPPLDGFTLTVRVPSATGSSPMLDITIQDAVSEGASYTTFATVPQITAAGLYKQRFFNRIAKPYIKVVQTVTSGSTVGSAHFGAVEMYLTHGDYPAINKTV